MKTCKNWHYFLKRFYFKRNEINNCSQKVRNRGTSIFMDSHEPLVVNSLSRWLHFIIRKVCQWTSGFLPLQVQSQHFSEIAYKPKDNRKLSQVHQTCTHISFCNPFL